ncbi:MAG: rod shape-determining protein RodA, partial [Candidatus Latescibacterota bacterium]
LCMVGLALIYSVFYSTQEEYATGEGLFFFKKQLLWLLFGIIAMFVGFVVPFRYFETLAYVFYVACVVLLIVVLFVGGGPQARRWIPIGPVSIQPSEFMKIALLFVWARILSGYSKNPQRFHRLLLVLIAFVVPFVLVLKEPDLGTAIMLFVMMLPILYWRGFKGLHILFVLSPIISGILILYGELIAQQFKTLPFGVYIVLILYIAYRRRAFLLESVLLVGANLGVGLILPMLWGNLKVYQQQRVLSFLNPGSDKLGAGWQVFQSKIAIGSGGLTGKGYLEGTQKALEFLPAKHTDFVFSVLGEELGFLGGSIVLALFFVLIVKALILADKSKSEFASTVCVGIAAYFFFQVAINVAMTIGMAPVTGIPLPFLSYGGSSLVVSYFLGGFLLNCSVRWFEY